MLRGVQPPYRPVEIRASASKIQTLFQNARVVKLVDTTDLKSVAPNTGVPVRFRSRAPDELQRPFFQWSFFHLEIRHVLLHHPFRFRQALLRQL